MLLCCIVLHCGSSCRRHARSCLMHCTNTMLPVVSLPVSPKRSLQQEKVKAWRLICSVGGVRRRNLLYCYPFNVSNFTLCFLTALATLKPQAGLIVPQAVPSSQPNAVVSDTCAGTGRACRSLSLISGLICLFSLYFRVLVNQWTWENWQE